MIILKALGLGFLAFVLVSIVGAADELSALAGLITTIIAMVILKGPKSVMASAAQKMHSVKVSIDSAIEEGDAALFAIAEQEVTDGKIDSGLWSQALVKANGDESRRKVEYMKLRAKELRRVAKLPVSEVEISRKPDVAENGKLALMVPKRRASESVKQEPVEFEAWLKVQRLRIIDLSPEEIAEKRKVYEYKRAHREI